LKIIDYWKEIKNGKKKSGFREEIHMRSFPGYMVIGRNGEDAGIFSDYLVFLGEIEFAVVRGYTPIIDLQNYPRFCIQDTDKYYKENAWEYFFEQPCGLGLDDISNLIGHIVYAPADFGSKVFHGMKLHRVWKEDEQLFHYWREMARRYIRLKPDVLRECENEFCKIRGGVSKIVGVAIREGYYLGQMKRGKAGGGYDERKVNVNRFIKETEKLLAQDKEINGIFVSCEFEGTIQKFQSRFPDKKILFVDKERFTSPSRYPYEPEDRKVYFDQKNKREIALNYIKEIFVLSKCDSYIYSECSGSVAVLLLKKENFDRCVYI